MSLSHISQFLSLAVLALSSGFEEIPSSGPYPSGVVNPCVIGKQRRHPKAFPYIRVIDEATAVAPDVHLGSESGGLPYYVIPSAPSEVVIECSSNQGKIGWEYKGRGVTSSLKVVPIIWTTPNKLRVSCHSAALVISKLTDQVSGEYSCVVDTKDGNKSVERFMLFVPRK